VCVFKDAQGRKLVLCFWNDRFLTNLITNHNSNFMKTRKILSFLAFATLFGIFSISTLNAQVTIGGATPPQQGAVLDLNANFMGGLLLPNVEITSLGHIPEDFSDVSVQGADVALELAGLVVYKKNTDADGNILKGVYIWDGNDWQL